MKLGHLLWRSGHILCLAVLCLIGPVYEHTHGESFQLADRAPCLAFDPAYLVVLGLFLLLCYQALVLVAQVALELVGKAPLYTRYTLSVFIKFLFLNELFASDGNGVRVIRVLAGLHVVKVNISRYLHHGPALPNGILEQGGYLVLVVILKPSLVHKLCAGPGGFVPLVPLPVLVEHVARRIHHRDIFLVEPWNSACHQKDNALNLPGAHLRGSFEGEHNRCGHRLAFTYKQGLLGRCYMHPGGFHLREPVYGLFKFSLQGPLVVYPLDKISGPKVCLVKQAESCPASPRESGTCKGEAYVIHPVRWNLYGGSAVGYAVGNLFILEPFYHISRIGLVKVRVEDGEIRPVCEQEQGSEANENQQHYPSGNDLLPPVHVLVEFFQLVYVIPGACHLNRLSRL